MLVTVLAFEYSSELRMRKYADALQTDPLKNLQRKELRAAGIQIRICLVDYSGK